MPVAGLGLLWCFWLCGGFGRGFGCRLACLSDGEQIAPRKFRVGERLGDLVSQFFVGPRRLASLVVFGEQPQRIVGRQAEPAHENERSLERRIVPALARDGCWHSGEIVRCASHADLESRDIVEVWRFSHRRVSAGCVVAQRLDPRRR